ncbi:hypothetical protein CTI12_AA284850 [Artemisia annua]|uniref:Helitron helicase-like domain-containing protein n=1 Tax=Artemisia annua TaxID=35608 RepID=A0A2U1N8P7_ARTAN|nr:hypothetical protein CTI12_AA284850 [Artemisia annua]
MKTKQKAIRRCSCPLDLAPDVGKIECNPETSKRNRSVCGDVVNNKRSRSDANLSCQISIEPSQKHVKHKQNSPGSYESAKYSVASGSSIPKCSRLSPNKLHNSEGISSSLVRPLNKNLGMKKTQLQSHIPTTSRYASAKGDTYSQGIDTTQGDVSVPVNAAAKNCHPPSKESRTQTEVPLNRRRKTTLKRHRHITAGYSPMETQPPSIHDSRAETLPNTATDASTNAKRPRYIQVTTESSNRTNHCTHTNTRQQRRVRKGPPDTYVSICSCNQHFKNSGSRLKREIVQKLKDVLDEYNELVKLFRTARDKMEDADVPDFKLKLFGVVGSKQYDLPSGDSIGAVVFEGGPDFSTEYDVVIQNRGGQPGQLDKLNPHYMSLHFPLIFIHGEVGYHLGLKLLGKAGSAAEKEKQMSMKMFYAY